MVTTNSMVTTGSVEFKCVIDKYGFLSFVVSGEKVATFSEQDVKNLISMLMESSNMANRKRSKGV